jgi:hypothetical protein
VSDATLSERQRAENRLFPFEHYLIDPRGRFVCVAIPKNGCTDLKHWFLSVAEPGLDRGVVRVHAHCRGQHALCRLAGPEIEAALARCFTFGFVRDPLSRVVSAYVEKFVLPDPGALFEPAREVVERIGGGGAGITFRAFVRYLRNAREDELESHWRPQASFVRGRRIDLLARVESLSSVLARLSRALGAEPLPSLRKNATGYQAASGQNMADERSDVLHAAGRLPPGEDLYDEELRGAVRERFAEDAELYARAAVELGEEAADLRVDAVT